MTDATGAISGDAVPGLVRMLVTLVAPHRPAADDPAPRLADDLGYHSLALADLGFTLEDLFGLEPLSPEQAQTLQTPGDVSDLILAELAAGNGQLPDADQVSRTLARYGVTLPPAG